MGFFRLPRWKSGPVRRTSRRNGAWGGRQFGTLDHLVSWSAGDFYTAYTVDRGCRPLVYAVGRLPASFALPYTIIVLSLRVRRDARLLMGRWRMPTGHVTAGRRSCTVTYGSRRARTRRRQSPAWVAGTMPYIALQLVGMGRGHQGRWDSRAELADPSRLSSFSRSITYSSGLRRARP